MKNTTFVGNIGEDIATEYLIDSGYKILARNAKICDCEIDIICEAYVESDGSVVKVKEGALKGIAPRFFKIRHMPKNAERTVVFCEVKTRYGNEFGTGAEAVTPYKIGRYVTASKLYMSSHKNINCNARFDIIEIADGKINHIVGAFNENDAKYPRKRR